MELELSEYKLLLDQKITSHVDFASEAYSQKVFAMTVNSTDYHNKIHSLGVTNKDTISKDNLKLIEEIKEEINGIKNKTIEETIDLFTQALHRSPKEIPNDFRTFINKRIKAIDRAIDMKKDAVKSTSNIDLA